MTRSAQIDALLGEYAHGPDLIEAALRGLSEEEVRFSPGPGHWSIHENIVHLADTELVYAARVRYLVAEPELIPASFRGFHWSTALAYPAQSLEDALHVFRAVRTTTARYLRALPPEAWARMGPHWDQEGAGAEPRRLSVADAVAAFRDHVHYHLRTIAKRRGQFTVSRGRA
ncbi:MAG TPA: DinB family protein [bacterium]|nr:DinB family protein [bacterium]